jgi:hypothetical protein
VKKAMVFVAIIYTAYILFSLVTFDTSAVLGNVTTQYSNVTGSNSTSNVTAKMEFLNRVLR